MATPLGLLRASVRLNEPLAQRGYLESPELVRTRRPAPAWLLWPDLFLPDMVHIVCLTANTGRTATREHLEPAVSVLSNHWKRVAGRRIN